MMDNYLNGTGLSLVDKYSMTGSGERRARSDCPCAQTNLALQNKSVVAKQN